MKVTTQIYQRQHRADASQWLGQRICVWGVEIGEVFYPASRIEEELRSLMYRAGDYRGTDLSPEEIEAAAKLLKITV